MDPDIDFAGTQGQFDTFLHAAPSYASLDGHAPLAVAGGDEETLFRLDLLTRRGTSPGRRARPARSPGQT